MNIEDIRNICMGFSHVHEDVKWGNDLVFSIGGKMFCAAGLEQSPTTASFKVTDEEFEELSAQVNFKPAPYLARHKWVLIEDINTISRKEWQYFLLQSYSLAKDKLPAKIKKQLGIH